MIRLYASPMLTLLFLQAQPHSEQEFPVYTPERAVSEMELRGLERMTIAVAWLQVVCSSSPITSTGGYPTIRHNTVPWSKQHFAGGLSPTSYPGQRQWTDGPIIIDSVRITIRGRKKWFSHNCMYALNSFSLSWNLYSDVCKNIYKDCDTRLQLTLRSSLS